MNLNRLSRILSLLLLSAWCSCAAELSHYSKPLAALIDPAKLSTLGPRRANPRVEKTVYWLEMARRDKFDPVAVADAALKSLGVTNAAVLVLTRAALLRNLDIAGKLGCLDEAGMAELKLGKSATIRRGPYTGDHTSVDHIIPFVVVPELDHTIANLELMPSRLNSSKRDAVGSRQRTLAEQFFRAGLLSAAGLKAVKAHS